MYKFEEYYQLGLIYFDQTVDIKMDQENCWVKKAETIPWEVIERKICADYKCDKIKEILKVEKLQRK